jgi:hypothetical protein
MRKQIRKKESQVQEKKRERKNTPTNPFWVHNFFPELKSKN